MRNLIRRLVRISTLGLVGSSPRNAERRARTRLAKAQARQIDRLS